MSTQAKHTPGPWTADICQSNTALSSVQSFGEVPEIHRPWNVAICTGPQSHANARLIAAAPELLEACKKARTCASVPDGVVSLLRAAIAKAEGKA